MLNSSHQRVTQKAFDILSSIDLKLRAINPEVLNHIQDIAREASVIDDKQDLEFIKVIGGFNFFSRTHRDDPHNFETLYGAGNDIAYYLEPITKINLTMFNHFIDIKKGSGIFDDYDGYSYQRGSGSRDQYQDASDAAGTQWEKALAYVLGGGPKKIDEGLAYYFKDTYAHVPGQQWYRPPPGPGCSPSVENYSFPGAGGSKYNNKIDEIKARFPLAESSTEKGNSGIPYSVFMPVDNMALYWYQRFFITRNPVSLGHVMHAIQDASIPHHAAGIIGNWHTRYEKELDSKLSGWLNDQSFTSEVKALFTQWWNSADKSSPIHLGVNDWNRVPAGKWNVDQLTTWIALNAYKDYDRVYNHFKNGYRYDESSSRSLTKLATAMSLFVLAVSVYGLPVQLRPPPLRKMVVGVTPSPIPLGKQVQVTVTAKDAESGNPVAGDVFIGSGRVSATNNPFMYTFNLKTIPGKPGGPSKPGFSGFLKKLPLNKKKGDDSRGIDEPQNHEGIPPEDIEPSGYVIATNYDRAEIPFSFRQGD